MAGIYFGNKQNQSAANSQIQTTVSEPYKFEYLASQCQQGIDNYKSLQPQFDAELQRLKKEVNYASSIGYTENSAILAKQLEDLSKSVSIVGDRTAKLESCKQSVSARLDFTASELAEINSFIVNSTAIPTPN